MDSRCSRYSNWLFTRYKLFHMSHRPKQSPTIQLNITVIYNQRVIQSVIIETWVNLYGGKDFVARHLVSAGHQQPRSSQTPAVTGDCQAKEEVSGSHNTTSDSAV